MSYIQKITWVVLFILLSAGTVISTISTAHASGLTRVGVDCGLTSLAYDATAFCTVTVDCVSLGPFTCGSSPTGQISMPSQGCLGSWPLSSKGCTSLHICPTLSTTGDVAGSSICAAPGSCNATATGFVCKDVGITVTHPVAKNDSCPTGPYQSYPLECLGLHDWRTANLLTDTLLQPLAIMQYSGDNSNSPASSLINLSFHTCWINPCLLNHSVSLDSIARPSHTFDAWLCLWGNSPLDSNMTQPDPWGRPMPPDCKLLSQDVLDTGITQDVLDENPGVIFAGPQMWAAAAADLKSGDVVSRLDNAANFAASQGEAIGHSDLTALEAAANNDPNVQLPNAPCDRAAVAGSSWSTVVCGGLNDNFCSGPPNFDCSWNNGVCGPLVTPAEVQALLDKYQGNPYELPVIINSSACPDYYPLRELVGALRHKDFGGYITCQYTALPTFANFDCSSLADFLSQIAVSLQIACGPGARLVCTGAKWTATLLANEGDLQSKIIPVKQELGVKGFFGLMDVGLFDGLSAGLWGGSGAGDSFGLGLGWSLPVCSNENEPITGNRPFGGFGTAPWGDAGPSRCVTTDPNSLAALAYGTCQQFVPANPFTGTPAQWTNCSNPCVSPCPPGCAGDLQQGLPHCPTQLYCKTVPSPDDPNIYPFSYPNQLGPDGIHPYPLPSLQTLNDCPLPGSAGANNTLAPIECVTDRVVDLGIGYDGDLNISVNGTTVEPFSNVYNAGLADSLGGRQGGRYTIGIEIAVSERAKFHNAIVNLRDNSLVHVCGRWVTDMREFTSELHPITSIEVDNPLTVIGTPDRPPDYNGWYNRPVKIAWSGRLNSIFDKDANITSWDQVVACDPPTTYSGPDRGITPLIGQCLDLAGNLVTNTTSILYDAIPPGLSIKSGLTNGRSYSESELSAGVTTDAPTIFLSGSSSESCAFRLCHVDQVLVAGRTVDLRTSSFFNCCSWSSNITLSPGSNDIPVQARDQAGNNASLLLHVIYTGDFAIKAGEDSLSFSAGSSQAETISIVPINRFSGTVNVDVSSPSAVSCNLDHSSIQAGSTATLTCSGSPGDYVVTMTGVSGTLSRNTSLTVHIANQGAQGSQVPGLQALALVGSIIALTIVASSVFLLARRKSARKSPEPNSGFPQFRKILIIVVLLASVQLLGPSGVHASVTDSPRSTDLNTAPSLKTIQGIQTPSSGCFSHSWSSSAWDVVRCQQPPMIPLSVGNTHDWTAQSSTGTLIAEVFGGFPSVTGLTSETDSQLGSGFYSLQLNTNTFTCNTQYTGNKDSTCWEQFLFSNCPNVSQFCLIGNDSWVNIQYWLIGYLNSNTSCPSQGIPGGSGWMSFGKSCFANSGSTETGLFHTENIQNLSNLELIGIANSGSDEVTLGDSSAKASWSYTTQVSVFGLSNHWLQAEFNIFGFGNGSEADFNSGTSITVQDILEISAGTLIQPSCLFSGTTGETNNLFLSSCDSSTGYMIFSESSTKPPTNTATLVFDDSTGAQWTNTENPPASVFDTATVTGVSGITPTGSLSFTFFLNNACSGTGIPDGTLSLSSGNAQSDAVRSLPVGTYSFQAVYGGDSNYAGSTSSCEQFNVIKFAPLIFSNLSASSIVVGQSMTDSAILRGASADAGGTFLYRSFVGSTCSGTALSSNTVSVTNGIVPTSPAQIFNSVGVYSWNTMYGGDANNDPAPGSCDAFSVNKDTPRISTQAGPSPLWSSTTNYPTPIDAQSCVVSLGFDYCIGGFNGTSATNAVYFAPLSRTGVGSWTPTTAYPTTIEGASCVADSAMVFCIGGGIDSGHYSNGVYFASLSSSGVGPWTLAASYPTTIQSESCVASSGFIYCVGGFTGVSTTSSVYFAQFSSLAFGGAWMTTTAYPSAVQTQSCLAVNGIIVCVGGTSTGGVYFASLSSSGVGQWTSATTYPTDIFGQSCVASSGLIFCIAGANRAGYVNGVYSAPIPSAAQGQWSLSVTYPTNAYASSCVINSGFVYCLGGYNGSIYSNSVYFAIVDYIVGGSVGDQASLSGGYPSSGLSGTVSYYVYSNGNCSGSRLVEGTSTVGPGNSLDRSSSFTPTMPGSYSFNAVYGGDASNTGATSTCEPFFIQRSATSTALALFDPRGAPVPNGSRQPQGALVYGTAFVSGAIQGLATTGSVTYYLYDNLACLGPPISSVTSTVGSNSPTVGPLSNGNYGVEAVYNGDTNYASSVSSCAFFAAGDPSVGGSLVAVNSLTLTAQLFALAAFVFIVTAILLFRRTRIRNPSLDL